MGEAEIRKPQAEQCDSYQNGQPAQNGEQVESLQIECSSEDDSCLSSDKQQEKTDASYLSLMRTNRPFRLFLASYLVTRAGDWFNYVACITAIEHILGKNSASSMTAISVLVIVRLLPNVVLSSVGGALADARDRRECMIALDCSASLVVLLFLFAYWLESILLIYIVTLLLESIAALYEPSKSAIIPLLVPDEDDLKKAMTLTVLAWAAMAAIGASLGGFAVAAFGVRFCFVINSISFATSALLMWCVGGSWSVVDEKEIRSHPSLWSEFISMTIDGMKYLNSSSFGPLVFMKFSAALIFGSADVLNVAFSQQAGSERGSSERLGLIFGFVGVGCVVGPLVADPLTDMKDPMSLLRAFLGALAIMSLSYLGMGAFMPFASICLFTSMRAAGSAVAWVDSSLLVQKFSAPEMLGRVTAVEYSLATMSEATSALLAGLLQDHADLSPQGVSYVMASIGVLFLIVWFIYYVYYSRGCVESRDAPSHGTIGREKSRAGEEAQLLPP